MLPATSSQGLKALHNGPFREQTTYVTPLETNQQLDSGVAVAGAENKDPRRRSAGDGSAFVLSNCLLLATTGDEARAQ